VTSYDASRWSACPTCRAPAIGKQCVPGGNLECANGHSWSDATASCDCPRPDGAHLETCAWVRFVRSARTAAALRARAMEAGDD